MSADWVIPAPTTIATRMTGPLDGVRVIDLGTRIAAPFCAGLLGEQGAEVIKIEQPARRRLHARDRAVRRQRRRAVLAVLGGRRARPQERHARPAHARGPGPATGASRRPPMSSSRTSGPARSSSGTSAPTDLDPRLVTVRISMFGQDGPYSSRPGLDRVGIGYGGLLHLTGYPDRPPVRVGVTISDYLTGVFAAQAAVARAVRARRARRQRRGHRRRALRRGAAHPRVDARRRTTGSASCATGRATASRTRAPLDNYPTARRQVRVHRRRLRRELRAAVQGDGPARPARRSALRQARRPRRARRRDQRHRRGVDRDARRDRASRSACVAHDVPGRDRVHRGRHLRRPAHAAPRTTS